MSTSITEAGTELEGTVAGSENCLPIGTRVAEFEITGIIGEGGFGIVYLARDHSLHRTVALKEYMPGVMAGRGSDQSVVVRSKRHQEAFDTGLHSFINEARLLAQFDHPALIKIHRFWEQNNTGYMAMRFYEGQTLKRILQDNPSFVTEAWLKVMLQSILEALEALYKVQILHRDISPENIMIQNNGEAVLLDFGAARQIISDMTQSLTVILKPGYAPIEQYADDPSMLQGPWTDLYSLAAVMYVAITGKSPPSSVARMIKDPMEALARGRHPGYSAAFLTAIDQALSVRPEHRPQSIAAFRALLGIEDLAAPPKAARQASRIEPASEKKATARPAARPVAARDISAPPRPVPAPAMTSESLDPETQMMTQMMTQPMTAAVMDAASVKAPVVPSGTRTRRSSGSAPAAAGAATARVGSGGPANIAAAAGKRRLLVLAVAGVLLIGVLAGVRSMRKPGPGDAATAAAVKTAPAPGPGTEQVVDEETLAWESLNQQPAVTADQVTGFIARFPNGRLIDQARARLDAVNRDAPATALTASAASAAAPATNRAANNTGVSGSAGVAGATATAPASGAETATATTVVAPEAATGTLSLSIKPWGTVTVDGIGKGVSPPLKRLVLAEGKHQVKVVNPNFPERVVEIEVSKKKAATLAVDFGQ